MLYEVPWEQDPESKYWTGTLEGASNAAFEHIDTAASEDTVDIATYCCRIHQDPYIPPVWPGSSTVQEEVQVKTRPLSAAEARLSPGSRTITWQILERALAPFWSPEQLKDIRIKHPPLTATGVLDTRGADLERYVQRGVGVMDLGTMLASIATSTWVRGTVLTRNTDYCLRRCELVPRSAAFPPSDLDPTDSVGATTNGPSVPELRRRACIENPYSIPPRRLWDLVNNRVVDIDAYAKEPRSPKFGWFRNKRQELLPRLPAGGYWAITHSWTNDMQRWMTPINNYRWPVPVPAGITLEEIRWQALRAGALYCWLDVLCIRQQMVSRDSNTPLNEEVRHREWSIDIPTIGNIYRQATNVMRYFNGLGRPLQFAGWDDDCHWINRAWTLQETRPEHRMVNAGVPEGMLFPLQALVEFNEGRKCQMREVLAPLASIIENAETEHSEEIPLLDSVWLKVAYTRQRALTLFGGLFVRVAWLIFILSMMVAVIFGDFVDRYEPTTLTLNVQRVIVASVLVGDFLLTNWLSSFLLPVAGPFAFEAFCAFIGAGSCVLMATHGVHLQRILMAQGGPVWQTAILFVWAHANGDYINKPRLPHLKPLREWLKLSPLFIKEIIMTIPGLMLADYFGYMPLMLWAWKAMIRASALVALYSAMKWLGQFALWAWLWLATRSLPEMKSTSPCCSILDLAHEMARRKASNERDKIAGLGYLMRCRTLPVYSEKASDEDAWIHLVACLPYTAQLELLFNFPSARACDDSNSGDQRPGPHVGSWIPTWKQVTELSSPRQMGVKLQRPIWPPHWLQRSRGLLGYSDDLREAYHHKLTYNERLGALFVPICARVLLTTQITYQHDPGSYKVKLAGTGSRDGPTHHFYCLHNGQLRLDGPTARYGTTMATGTTFLLISLTRDDDEGPMPWIVAALQDPDPAKHESEWRKIGFGKFYNGLGHKTYYDHEANFQGSDGFGLESRACFYTLVVEKIGVLVTDDIRPLTRSDRLSVENYAINAPVIFV